MANIYKTVLVTLTLGLSILLIKSIKVIPQILKTQKLDLKN